MREAVAVLALAALVSLLLSGSTQPQLQVTGRDSAHRTLELARCEGSLTACLAGGDRKAQKVAC